MDNTCRVSAYDVVKKKKKSGDHDWCMCNNKYSPLGVI